MSLCKISSAPRLLAACCTWSTRKSSLGFFQVMGQVLAVQVWLSWWDWWVSHGFSASLCRCPTSKGNPSIFCWPVTLMFYVVSLHVLRNQPGNRRVGNLAAVRLLWSIILQRRVEHSCGQTSRRNTCYTTAILCVWFPLTIHLVSGYTISASHWEPIGLCSGTLLICLSLQCHLLSCSNSPLPLSWPKQNYLLPTNNDDVDWKPWIENQKIWTPRSRGLCLIVFIVRGLCFFCMMWFWIFLSKPAFPTTSVSMFQQLLWARHLWQAPPFAAQFSVDDVCWSHSLPKLGSAMVMGVWKHAPCAMRLIGYGGKKGVLLKLPNQKRKKRKESRGVFLFDIFGLGFACIQAANENHCHPLACRACIRFERWKRPLRMPRSQWCQRPWSTQWRVTVKTRTNKHVYTQYSMLHWGCVRYTKYTT